MHWIFQTKKSGYINFLKNKSNNMNETWQGYFLKNTKSRGEEEKNISETILYTRGVKFILVHGRLKA